MSRSKDKGTAWESAIVSYLRESGARYAERRALHGTQDRGDVAGIPGVVIEAKDERRHDLAGWITEAQAEGARDGASVWAVWAKRVRKTSPGDAYVIMTGDVFVRLLREAGYLPES